MKTVKRSAKLIVILGLLLVSLMQVGLSNAAGKPRLGKTETNVRLEATCDEFSFRIENESGVGGMTVLEIRLDGKRLVKHPIYLRPHKVIERTIKWQRLGISVPLTEGHEIEIKTKDDEALAKIDRCSPPTPEPALGSITTHKFHDGNENGKQDSGEDNIAQWSFSLFGRVKNQVRVIDEGQTDANGNLSFDNLAPGRYFVWEELDDCWAPTTRGKHLRDGFFVPVRVFRGHEKQVEIGNVNRCGPGPGPGELASITVQKWAEPADDGTKFSFTLTGQSGFDLMANESTSLDELNPGAYQITELVPADWSLLRVVCDGTDKDVDEGKVTVTLGEGDDVTCIYKNKKDEEPVPTAGIDVEKYVSTDEANWQDADTPDQALVVPLPGDLYFRITVENTGPVALTDIQVGDSTYPLSSCDVPATLAADDFFECVIGPFEAQEGLQVNQAWAAGNYNGTRVKDYDLAKHIGEGEVGDVASLDIEKSTNGADADTPTGPAIPVGEPVTWTYVVTNDGDVTLNNIVVTDDQGVAVDCGDGSNEVANLAPGESATCTASGVAEAGQYTNVGTASTTYEGQEVSATDPSHYLGVVPAAPDVSIFKGPQGDPEGEGPVVVFQSEDAPFTIRVQNTGDVPLVYVEVIDTPEPDEGFEGVEIETDCNAVLVDVNNGDQPLEVDEARDIDCLGFAGDDWPANFTGYTNVAEVVARDEAGNEVTARDDVEVDFLLE